MSPKKKSGGKPEPEGKNIPPRTALAQQTLSACTPTKAPLSIAATCWPFSATCLIVGILLVIATSAVNEVSVTYCSKGDSKNCDLAPAFNLGSTMKAPVYVYYELSNMHQNHRRFVDSRSNGQLSGDTTYKVSDCTPRSRNANGVEYYPCGLTAGYYFNDQIELYNATHFFPQSTLNIAWDFDRKKLYKRRDTTGMDTSLGVDILDPRFMTWMSIAPFPTFRKLWGVIHEDLPAGQYHFQIASRWAQIDGDKAVVLSTSSWAGGRNIFLGVLFLVLAGVTAIIPLVFCIGARLRPQVDMSDFRVDVD